MAWGLAADTLLPEDMSLILDPHKMHSQLPVTLALGGSDTSGLCIPVLTYMHITRKK